MVDDGEEAFRLGLVLHDLVDRPLDLLLSGMNAPPVRRADLLDLGVDPHC